MARSFFLLCSPTVLKLRQRGLVLAVQEGDAFAVECIAHRLQMHQVGAAADLDVALDRRGLESIEQPRRIGVGNEPVPLAADDRDRRLHTAWIISQLAVPGAQDVDERAGRNLDPSRLAAAALAVA